MKIKIKVQEGKSSKKCYENFTKENYLQNQEKTDPDDKSLKCDENKKIFNLRNRLIIHLQVDKGKRSKHQKLIRKKTKNFEQKNNKPQIKNQKNLKNNFKKSKKMSFKCDTCDKVFSKKIAMIAHVRIHNKKSNSNFKNSLNTVEFFDKLELAKNSKDSSLNNLEVHEKEKEQPNNVLAPSEKNCSNKPGSSSSATKIQNKEKSLTNNTNVNNAIEIIDIDNIDVAVKVENTDRSSPDIFMIKDVQKKKIFNSNNKTDFYINKTFENEIRDLVSDIKNEIKSLIHSLK